MNGIGEIIDISKIFTSIAKKKKKRKFEIQFKSQS